MPRWWCSATALQGHASHQHTQRRCALGSCVPVRAGLCSLCDVSNPKSKSVGACLCAAASCNSMLIKALRTTSDRCSCSHRHHDSTRTAQPQSQLLILHGLRWARASLLQPQCRQLRHRCLHASAPVTKQDLLQTRQLRSKSSTSPAMTISQHQAGHRRSMPSLLRTASAATGSLSPHSGKIRSSNEASRCVMRRKGGCVHSARWPTCWMPRSARHAVKLGPWAGYWRPLQRQCQHLVAWTYVGTMETGSGRMRAGNASSARCTMLSVQPDAVHAVSGGTPAAPKWCRSVSELDLSSARHLMLRCTAGLLWDPRRLLITVGTAKFMCTSVCILLYLYFESVNTVLRCRRSLCS